ncbi:hypothetical protein [Shinella fusca]|uniref:Uncharacterized protein n=1 Tax=Shinella fusca TaxID=544480 RepID=A0A7W7YW71_9HYPH|nr:hypothetical protein [Shinella fusca]MBB5043540.1 hypothetical protein [Shinella fusca]
MYLTYRKSGVRFQIAVPADLHSRLGRTPIRIPLGMISATSARRIARLLSGHAERLPLLGTITGARIAELIFLQRKDIYRVRGDDGLECWVLDLRTDLIAEGGGTQKRKTKNKPSRRLIALHETF